MGLIHCPLRASPGIKNQLKLWDADAGLLHGSGTLTSCKSAANVEEGAAQTANSDARAAWCLPAQQLRCCQLQRHTQQGSTHCLRQSLRNAANMRKYVHLQQNFGLLLIYAHEQIASEMYLLMATSLQYDSFPFFHGVGLRVYQGF